MPLLAVSYTNFSFIVSGLGITNVVKGFCNQSTKTFIIMKFLKPALCFALFLSIVLSHFGQKNILQAPDNILDSQRNNIANVNILTLNPRDSGLLKASGVHKLKNFPNVDIRKEITQATMSKEGFCGVLLCGQKNYSGFLNGSMLMHNMGDPFRAFPGNVIAK
jgi:hypothetical protein